MGDKITPTPPPAETSIMSGAGTRFLAILATTAVGVGTVVAVANPVGDAIAVAVGVGIVAKAGYDALTSGRTPPSTSDMTESEPDEHSGEEPTKASAIDPAVEEARAKAAAQVATRVEALKRAPIKSLMSIGAIERKAKGADLVTLQRDVALMLDDAEAQTRDFPRSLGDLERDLQASINPALVNDKNEHVVAARDKLARVKRAAPNNLDQAILQLGDLDVLIEAVRTAVAAAHASRIRYEALLQAVGDAVRDMPARSPEHKGFMTPRPKAYMEQAQIGAAGLDFDLAIGLLLDAQKELNRIDVAARTRGAKLADEELNRQAEEQQRQQIAAAVAQQAAAQLAAENAANEASLAAIGKTSQFMKWYNKVEELLGLNIVRITGSAPFFLRGDNTVEVVIRVVSVATRNEIDRFVVHYHPEASGASVDNRYASQIHIKPIRGNATTQHHTIDNNAWLITSGYAPPWRDIRQNFR